MKGYTMDWGYISGYFDGEGHVIFTAPPSRKNYVVTGLTWANTNLESLEAMKTFMGAGRIIRKAKKGTMHSDAYTLAITKRDQVLMVGEKMLPHLIIKRARVEDMLAFVRNNRKAAPSSWGVLASVGAAEISRLYWDEGLKQSEIADKFGCSRGAVSTFFIRNNIEGRRSGPAEGAYGVLASHGREKLFAMYQSGMTYRDIARELGVKVGTVQSYFWREGKVKLTKAIRDARKDRK